MATTRSKAAAAPAKEPGTKVTKVKQGGALALPDDFAAQLLQDSGLGMELAKAMDFALPFLYVLQALSPQVQPRDSKYVEGAAAGMLMDTVNLTLWDAENEPVELIPVEFESVVNEWIPRDAGGGFIATHRSRAEAEASQKEGTQLVDTANHYVLAKTPDGEWVQAVLSLTSTKLRASRKWMSVQRGVLVNSGNKRVPAPTFSRRYLLQSIPEQKDKHHYYNVKISPVEGNEGWVADPMVYQAAKDFYAALKAGRRGADFAQTTEDVEAEVVEEEDSPNY